ncbi:adenylate isopentenyltransferase 5, chloroplastic-like isoform X2 [Wolffia australiana]
MVRGAAQAYNKVIIVIGATGTGKSRLSLDIAANFPSEIINSDKIQVYKGLNVVTNKVTEEEQAGVPHHLLGVIDPDDDFTATDFRRCATEIVAAVQRRRRLPIVAGGSNSFVEALVNGTNFDCCFLWVDVALPVLHEFVSGRVDQMVDMGLVEEAKEMFREDGDYSKGIRRAIGVPELHKYFQEGREELIKDAVEEIKENTRQLACRQLQKIKRMARLGFDVHRLDATEAFCRRGGASDEAWNRLVAEPAAEIVRRFLMGGDERGRRERGCSVKAAMGGPAVATAMAMAGSSM